MVNCVLDLSHHNGTVDFEAVKASGIVGVIHKATQGLSYIDPLYFTHRDAAKAQGLLFGAYHFGVEGDGVAEADHFLAVVNPFDSDLLVLDFEHATPGTHDMVLPEADAFIERVNQHRGIYPGLYSGDYVKEMPAAKLDPILKKCWLWLASYTATPILPSEWPSWTLWQHTDKGQVPGVNGYCDLSFFCSDNPEDLKKFWGVEVDSDPTVGSGS